MFNIYQYGTSSIIVSPSVSFKHNAVNKQYYCVTLYAWNYIKLKTLLKQVDSELDRQNEIYLSNILSQEEKNSLKSDILFYL